MHGERLDGISEALGLIAEALRLLNAKDARAVLAMAHAVVGDADDALERPAPLRVARKRTEEKVLEALSSGPLGLQDVVSRVGSSRSGVSAALRKLAEEGRVAREGEGRASTWKLVGSAIAS